jgi:hypothetical protein
MEQAWLKNSFTGNRRKGQRQFFTVAFFKIIEKSEKTKRGGG